MTTERIRHALVKDGWHLIQTTDEVFVIKPDDDGQVDYASNLIELIEETDDEFDEERDALS